MHLLYCACFYNALKEEFRNVTDQVMDHPDQFCRVQGEILKITHVDAEGETLELEINCHPADKIFFVLIDAMRMCKGLPKVAFLKKTFGPSMHDEEGKDFHASGYGLSCDAFASKGAVLLDGTVVQDAPQGHQTYTDPSVNPVGADTAIPFTSIWRRSFYMVVLLVMVSSLMASSEVRILTVFNRVHLQARFGDGIHVKVTLSMV